MIEEWMPAIAIGGGCVLLLALVCVMLWISRRRNRQGPRRTSFHMVVIDPRVARERRAAFEHSAPPRDEQLEPICEELVTEDIPIDHSARTAPSTDRTVIGYSTYAPALLPRAPQDLMHRHERERHPRRFARGSRTGIESPSAPALPARPTDWELGAPSVTARMRAAKRT